MNTTSLRTQIILPNSLREQIEEQRHITGESLAEYLREAARQRLVKEGKRKTDLIKLADDFMGFVKTHKKSEKVLRQSEKEMRQDRQEGEKHWLKRVDEALRN